MAIRRYLSSATATDDGGGNITVNKPPGTTDGHWMTAIVVASGVQTITPPAGWTQKYLSADSSRGIWEKKAASEGSNYTFTIAGGANPRASAAAIITDSGGDPDVGATMGSPTAVTGTTITGAGLTAGSGVTMLRLIGMTKGTTTTSLSATAPAGMKERVDIDNSDSSGTDAQVHIYAAGQYTLAGAVADRIATLNQSRDNIGILMVFYQEALVNDGAPEPVETLIEMDRWDEAGLDVDTELYSESGVTFTGHELYRARIMSPVEVREYAVDTIGMGGRAALTVSEIELDNADHALDDIAERGLALGRDVTIKTIPVTNWTASDFGAGASSNAVTVFKGVVAALTPIGTRMRLAISDHSERLNIVQQKEVYDGTAGLGGDAELAGMTMPLTIGYVYNMRPQALGAINLGDGSLLTYQVNGGDVNDIVAVRENGAVYAEVGVAPGVGQYRQWLSDGVFQIGSTPTGEITCDVKGDDPSSDIYANQTAEVVERLITRYGPELATSVIDATSFDDIDAEMPGEIGLAMPSGDRSTAAQVVDRVLAHAALWLAGSRSGTLRMSFARPGPAERIILREADIVSLKPLRLPSSLQPAPVHIDVTAERNWAHPMSQIAGSVTGSQLRKLSGPGRTMRATSSVILQRQLPVGVWKLPGLFKNNADAQMFAEQLSHWVTRPLRAFEVVTDRCRNKVEMGYVCDLVSYPRFDLTSGFSGIVSGWGETPRSGRVSMILIG